MAFFMNMPDFSTSNVLRVLLKLIRKIYIGFAIYLICHGYYETFLMVKEGNIVVRNEVRQLPKYRYPSLTFCYIYKDGVSREVQNRKGHKSVWWLYYRHYIDKWTKSGMCIYQGCGDPHYLD